MSNTRDVDRVAADLTGSEVSALRYENYNADPREGHGLIAGMLAHGSRVLDVGCGTGSLSMLLRDVTGARVVGLEPDAERAAAARARNVEVIEALLSPELVHSLGQFDAVIFADVLEHLAEPAAALRVATAMLAPGGCVFASVPNVAHWSIRWNLLCGRFEYTPLGLMDATHLRWFTRRSIRELFERCALRVVEVRGSVGYWLPEYQRWPGSIPPYGVVRRLVDVWPELFACQHVVKATPV